jgi:UDP-3-O-[3-hydroxymyristoyl] N-acetylglucosamine deacetylase / 3-hydroxyacyl-[acyl-carrier-protein] dehydratase
MAKKQKSTDTLNLESILFNCREYLRSNASLNDKRDLLLTLVFLRFIGEKFENTQNDMRQECINNGITDETVISSFLNSPSRYKGIAFVAETTRGTVLRQNNVQVGTVEHGLAALYASGVDNCVIEVNAPEFPILDGSAKIYMEEIAKVGVVEQNQDKNYFVVTEKIVYEAPNGVSRIELLPADKFSVEVEIGFDSPVLGSQTAKIDDFTTFSHEIAPCRTFVFVRELEPLLKMNLIRGGDLTNALVIYDQPAGQEELQRLSDLMGQPCPKAESLGYLNTDLRFDNEPARHKLLDLVGDLSLIGQPILGKIVAMHPGHSVNTALGKQIRLSNIHK